MEGHGKQTQMALVSFLVGLHSVAMRPPAPAASPACDAGYYQRDPIVLKCQGGAEKKILQLTKAGTAHSFFYWRAPMGTKDLQATFTLSAVEDGDKGLTALEINCIDKHTKDKKKLVEHASGTILNEEQLTGKDFLSHWSWSGNPKKATAGRFEVWFRVNGTLHCDIEVHLANKHASRLHGYIEYTWAGITPCPESRLGCVPCPKDYCSAGKTAHCQGGHYVECHEAPAEVPASASETSEAQQSGATSRSNTSTAAATHGSGSTELSKTTAKPSSHVAAAPTTPPGQQKIEGLFEISAVIGSGADVTRRSFKLMIEAALAAALHVPRSSLVRFRVVDVTSVVGASSSKGRLLQSHRDVVLAVAYRLLMPADREDQLISMLQNMGKGEDKGSGLLGHFSKILGSHGVSVNAFKAVYPPSWVTKEEEEEEANQKALDEAPGDDLGATTTPNVGVLGAPMQSPMVKGIQSPKLPESGAVLVTTTSPDALTEPSWSSTKKVFTVGFAALLGAMVVCGICALLQMYSLRSSRVSHLDAPSASRHERSDQLNRVTSEDRHLLDMDSTPTGDSPGRNARGFPAGYEPVSGQDGGRFVGNEGM